MDAVLIVLVAALAMGPPDHPPPLSERAQSIPASTAATPELLASFPLRITAGAWAEYSIRSRGAQGFRVRFSIVPPALEGGRAWVEAAALGEMALPFAARLLVRSGGGVERALLYVLGQAPVELPTDTAPAERQSRRARSSRIVAVARREVSVPAGRFDAEEVRVSPRGQALRAWRSERVPLWGLVRAEGARQVVELVAYGQSGARSVFPDVQGNGSESTK